MTIGMILIAGVLTFFLIQLVWDVHLFTLPDGSNTPMVTLQSVRFWNLQRDEESAFDDQNSLSEPQQGPSNILEQGTENIESRNPVEQSNISVHSSRNVVYNVGENDAFVDIDLNPVDIHNEGYPPYSSDIVPCAFLK